MRKKERKPRALKPECSRQQFFEKFGHEIESYAAYKRAIEGLNVSTKNNYRRTLPNYFIHLGEDPDTVIENRKKDVTSFDVTECENYERKTKAYLKIVIDKKISVEGHVSRIQGFFSNNSKRLSLDLSKMKFPKARKTRKYSPDNVQVRALFGVADCARDKFIVAVMSENGPAPIDVAALKVGSYPEEPWVYFEFSRSKTGEIWRGVSTPDVCEALKAYTLIRKGKVGEPLLVGREGPLDNSGVSQVVRELIIKAGFGGVVGFKPTSLRDYFEDSLTDAEIYSKVKEALMGHTSGIQFEYGSRDKMESRLVEAMKKVYPLICLTNLSVDTAGLDGLSSEDRAAVKEIAKEKDFIVGLCKLLRSGELVNIYDPELPKKMRELGLL